MKSKNFFYISDRNANYKTRLIEVSNGAYFEVLKISELEAKKASNILYLHVNRTTKQCYIGITEQEAHKRWFSGIAYTNNRRFGAAIKKYGWSQFDSYILAFAETREQLNQVEMEAISIAGGHKSKFTYNLSPGGDLIAENDIPVAGVNLKTGEERVFKSGSDASRKLGFKATDMPMAVARGDRSSVGDWWFRYESDISKKPPTVWGNKLRIQEVRKKQSKNLIATSYSTGDTRRYETLDEAATDLGVKKSHISLVALGKNSSANGWWIKYEGDERKIPTKFGSALSREKRDQTVYAINLTTGVKGTFRNCTVADTELEIHKGAAASVISGNRASAAGWWFSLDPKASPPVKFKGALVAEARSKPIYAINIETKEETLFNSAKEAGTALGIHRSSISNIIKDKTKTAKGYSFRLADPTIKRN